MSTTQFDETTPVLSREELIVRLGGLKETAQIVSKYTSERRERKDKALKRYEALMGVCDLRCDIPYSDQKTKDQLAALLRVHEERKNACFIEARERVTATKALEEVAPWARDLTGTRKLLSAYFRKNPLWNSSPWYLERYLFAEDTDTVDLAETISFNIWSK